MVQHRTASTRSTTFEMPRSSHIVISLLWSSTSWHLCGRFDFIKVDSTRHIKVLSETRSVSAGGMLIDAFLCVLQSWCLYGAVVDLKYSHVRCTIRWEKRRKCGAHTILSILAALGAFPPSASGSSPRATLDLQKRLALKVSGIQKVNHLNR